jgi:hypothetical protein
MFSGINPSLVRYFDVEGEDGDKGPVFHLLLERNNTIGECKQGMVLANAYIQPGVVNGSPLPYDDAASFGKLTAVYFNS